METVRAPKRRKLDSSEKDHRRSLPAQISGKTTHTHTHAAASATNGTRSSSATHQSWAQAKAKAQENRGRRIASTPQKARAVDIYDDIEGAYSARSKLKPLANSAPKTKLLDPLRNQAPASPAKSSPLKANGGLDFFKRFAKPKTENESPKKKAEEHLVSGSRPGSEAAAVDVEMHDVDQDASVTQTGKGAWKNWAYAEKPKKTFEDEIRDLEKAAKEKAENEEDEGSADRSALRRRGRQSVTPVVASQEPKATSKVESISSSTPRTAKTVGRTKRQIIDPKPSVQHEEEKASGAREVVNVENELEQQLQAEIGIQPAVSTPFKQKLQQPAKKTAQKFPETTLTTNQLQNLTALVLGQLTNKSPVRLKNLDDEYAKVSNMIAQAVTAGESNSMLLIGSRGSGKTALINQILREQAAEHPNDFHVVRLNGFIHTNDKIALREIWRQLGREMELDEEESNLKNYADTLTSLLALLSHPAEQGREQEQGHVTKSVIFILDEFELFASHPRQTLLYNLFDIAQSRKAPITVLGLTTKIDVAETLEKRVKSRFSHRYVHLSVAKSFAAFQEACKAALVVDPNVLNENESALLGSGPSNTSSKSASTALDQWSALVDALFAQDEMTAHLQHIYYTTKSIPDFQSSMLLPITALPTLDPTTAPDIIDHLTPTTTLSAPDSKISLLSSLSTLHVALLICAARLTAIHAQDTIPFVQAYEEYKSIASKAKIQASASGALAQGAGSRIYGKDVAGNVWAELVGMGVIMEDGARGGRVDVGLEEIGMSGVELGAWGRWCREI